MDSREVRLIENEKLFRKANDRLEKHVAGLTTPNQVVPFLCECIDRDCVERVELTLGQYEQIRTADNFFLIAPAHPMLDAERLVSRTEQVWVVAKPGER
jgi:hypothetical protein